ncbi:uncharacterized protein LOC130957915 [Arachis stenosperma]|uniref:uncharacterized protein LOC130957915 n=1 Tax=Arachis stenosperma TaxID=217475 RepID=UPI0025AC789E|nr:uncharacterized protein LOC130957915 [Arachis stenosperma]
MKPHKSTSTPQFPNNVADITCMDQPIVAEKACKTVRLIGFLIQNGVSKSNINMQDFMRRGKSIGKALNNAVARHHEALTCRGDAATEFVSPLDYQFSCSGSPPRPSYYAARRRLSPIATAHGERHSPQAHKFARMCRGGEGDALVRHYYPVRRRVKIAAAGSPSAASSLAAAEEEKEEFRVDEAAEEFIERFYRDLRLQKWLDHCC